MKVYMKQKFFSLVDQYKLYDANEKLLYYTEGKLAFGTGFWYIKVDTISMKFLL